MKNGIHRQTLGRIANGVRRAEDDPLLNRWYDNVTDTHYDRFVRITSNAGGGYYDVVEVRHHDNPMLTISPREYRRLTLATSPLFTI